MRVERQCGSGDKVFVVCTVSCRCWKPLTERALQSKVFGSCKYSGLVS